MSRIASFNSDLGLSNIYTSSLNVMTILLCPRIMLIFDSGMIYSVSFSATMDNRPPVVAGIYPPYAKAKK